MASNLARRVLTGVVGAALVIGLAYLGGLPFTLLVVVVALLAQHELYAMMRHGGLNPYDFVGLGIGLLVAVRALASGLFLLAIVVSLLVVAIVPLRSRHEQPLADLAATFFGILYPTAFFSFLLDLRLTRGPLVHDLEAFYLTLSTLLLVWATDTFAYFTGRAIGRRKLAPSISPNKTWEGAVGGALGAVVVALVLKLTLLAFVPTLHLLVVALIGGVISQFGDLAESRMKRSVGVKDSGTILPGHGGMLDRFDALILAAPLVYLYLAHLAHLYH